MSHFQGSFTPAPPVLAKYIPFFLLDVFKDASFILFFANSGQRGGYKSKKRGSDCGEIDSCHGNHMDAGIFVGFLSDSIYRIPICHRQQLSRWDDIQMAFRTWCNSLVPPPLKSVLSKQVYHAGSMFATLTQIDCRFGFEPKISYPPTQPLYGLVTQG